MPLSTSSSNSFKTTLWMFLGLVLILGTAKTVVLNQIPQERRGLPDGYFRAKAQNSDHFDVVIAGDSRIYRGVSPTAMSTVLQDTTMLNFGFSSAGHSSLYLQAAEERLDKKGRKILVLGISPNSLTELAGENEHYLESLSGSRFAHLARPVEQICSTKETRRAFEFLTGRLGDYRQTPHGDGWVESTRVPPDPTIALRPYRSMFGKRRVSPRIEDELLVYVAGLRQRGVRVFGFRPPTTPDMEALENELSGFDEQEFSRRFSEAGGTWIACEDRFGYTTHDGAHLTGESAIRFSKYIARFISLFPDSAVDAE